MGYPLVVFFSFFSLKTAKIQNAAKSKKLKI